jgi:hypothetical protein
MTHPALGGIVRIGLLKKRSQAGGLGLGAGDWGQGAIEDVGFEGPLVLGGKNGETSRQALEESVETTLCGSRYEGRRSTGSWHG